MYLSGALTAGGSPSATTSTTVASGSSHGGLSPLWAAFFVTAGILLLLEVLPRVIGRFVAKKHCVNDAYYKGLLLGTDNRLSTSKLNASLWTVVEGTEAAANMMAGKFFKALEAETSSTQ